MYTDVPSPPRNLHQSTPDNTFHATIEWDAPVFTGGDGIATLMYAITIPGANYFMEESCTGSCSHTITADGIFNTSYDVEVTAVNTCGEKSSPESITVRGKTNGDLSITFIINPRTHAQKWVIVVGLCIGRSVRQSVCLCVYLFARFLANRGSGGYKTWKCG